MTNPAQIENLSFEEAIAELEQLVSTMEQGDLPLEAALGAFEKGIQLANLSQQKLKQAEQKIKMLVEKNGAQALVDVPLTQSDSGDTQ